MRRPLLPPTSLLATSLVLLAGDACTVFNGLPVDPPEAGVAVIDATAPSALLPNLADSVDVCALVFACPGLSAAVAASAAVPVSDYNFSLCLTWLNGPLDPNRPGAAVQSNTLGCIAPASSCDAAMGCLSVQAILPDDPRCASDAGSCTDQNGVAVAINCAKLQATSCGAPRFEPGTECISAGGQAECGLGLCTDASVPACLDGVQIACDPETGVKQDLIAASLGRDCASPQLPCSTPGATLCADASVMVCDGEHFTAYDCSTTAGGTCVMEGNAAYCRQATNCSPDGTGVTYCEAGTLHMCVGGAPQTFECATQGLRCKPALGNQTAHCG